MNELVKGTIVVASLGVLIPAAWKAAGKVAARTARVFGGWVRAQTREAMFDLLWSPNGGNSLVDLSGKIDDVADRLDRNVQEHRQTRRELEEVAAQVRTLLAQGGY